MKDQLLWSPSPFHTSLILLALPHIKNEKALEFLLSQKSVNWTWNYWLRGKEDPPPDDWDDTACALAALSLHAPELITGEVWAMITKLLVETETETGGPYLTWIVPREQHGLWLDKDIVVNSNIGYFLHLHGIHLPKLEAFAEHCIINDSYPSKYYVSKITALYFISRFYKGSLKEKAIAEILACRNTSGTWSNDLETTLALSTLLRWDIAIDRIPNISEYKPHPLYIEEIKDGEPIYSGSKELTEAFCKETVYLYKKAQEIEHVLEIYEKIIASVQERFERNNIATILFQYISQESKGAV